MLTVRSISLATMLVTFVPAQSEAPDPTVDLVVPLHGGADDPVGGEYGLWAAGPDWKASFHDGFAFYPYRGPDRPLVSLRWYTESVTVGARELVTANATTHTEAWRHELDYGPVTEVYEIRREGVEQMFVLERPVGDGDVVVTGRVQTPLHAEPQAEMCRSLDFCDGTEPAVRYGEALAFDAAGNRAPVTTAYDGDRIRLRLDRRFLANARYPVTIDPLSSSIALSFNATGKPATMTRLAVDNSSPGGYVVVGIVRQFAAGDADAHAVRFTHALTESTTVFSDNSTAWSTSHIDAAHVDGVGLYMFAIQRDFSPSSYGVRVYFHGQGSTTINSGETKAVASQSHLYRNPQISGARGGGRNGLLVLEAVSNSTPKVQTILIDGVARGFGSPHDIELTPAQRSWHPAVVQYTNNQASWVAAWKSGSPLFDTEIWMAQIGSDGAAYRNVELWRGELVNEPMAVDGSWDFGTFQGRYLFAFAEERDAAHEDVNVIGVKTDLAGTVTVRRPRVAAQGATNQQFSDLDLAHDWRTRSHWGLAYTARIGPVHAISSVARLGKDGGVTERQTLHASTSNFSGATGVGFVERNDWSLFIATFGVETSAFPVYGRRFTFPVDATATSYGAGCDGGQISAPVPPYAGHEFFTLETEPVSLLESVFYLFALAPDDVDLSPYGMPACRLLIDLNTLISVGASQFSPLGVHSLGLPLPDLFKGDLYVQTLVFPHSGAPFLTQGLRLQVR